MLGQAPDVAERLVVSAVQPMNRQDRVADGAGAGASRGLRPVIDVSDVAVTECHPSHRMGEQSRAGGGAGSAEAEDPSRAVDGDPGAEESRSGQCASQVGLLRPPPACAHSLRSRPHDGTALRTGAPRRLSHSPTKTSQTTRSRVVSEVSVEVRWEGSSAGR